MAKPFKPEPKFFLDDHYETLVDTYIDRYFSDVDNSMVCGEKSTSYLEYPVVASRIKRTFPDARIIITLRNPIARAISNYLFSRSFGLEMRTPDEVFIDHVPPPVLNTRTSVSPFSYFERGNYLHYIKPYISIFGRERVKVIVLEDFSKNSQEHQDLFTFLGVDPHAEYHIPQGRVNSAQFMALISDKVIDALYEYYERPIYHLSQYLKKDLSRWTETRRGEDLHWACIEDQFENAFDEKNKHRNH